MDDLSDIIAYYDAYDEPGGLVIVGASRHLLSVGRL